jgi:hypothetical protein
MRAVGRAAAPPLGNAGGWRVAELADVPPRVPPLQSWAFFLRTALAIPLQPAHSEFPIDEAGDVPAAAPPALPTALDEWEQIFDGLRQRFPGASPGVLFCIHKLQQNPDLKLRDFKEEAALHRVPLSGRSYHSARVMLGLERAAPRPRKRQADAEEGAESTALSDLAEVLGDAEAGGAESPLIAALRRYQSEHAAEMERLRAGIRQAIDLIDAVLDQGAR